MRRTEAGWIAWLHEAGNGGANGFACGAMRFAYCALRGDGIYKFNLQPRGKIMTSKRLLTGISMLFVLVTLSACGGGGGGGGGGGAAPAPTSTTCTWDTSTWDNCTWGS